MIIKADETLHPPTPIPVGSRVATCFHTTTVQNLKFIPTPEYYTWNKETVKYIVLCKECYDKHHDDLEKGITRTATM